jgi:hypothetical protein
VHWITALDRDFRLAHLHLPAGVPCLAEDVNVGEIMAFSPDRFHAKPFPETPAQGPDLLCCCPGGYGDMLSLEPILRHWRTLHPSARMAVLRSPHAVVLDELEGLDLHTVPYPVPSVVAATFGTLFFSERRIQSAPTRHPTDIFAEALGLVLADKRPRYHVTEDEAKEAARRFPKTARPRIGFHVRSTALCRTYPRQVALLDALVSAGRYQVVLFGAPGEARADDSPDRGLVNLCNHKLTIRQSAAVLATCDAFICPDSGLLHIAGALGIPTVALFGSFPAKARARYYPSVRALTGHAPCAPCNHHVRADRQWPAGQPCEREGRCVALAKIEPAAILAALDSQLSAAGK